MSAGKFWLPQCLAIGRGGTSTHTHTEREREREREGGEREGGEREREGEREGERWTHSVQCSQFLRLTTLIHARDGDTTALVLLLNIQC